MNRSVPRAALSLLALLLCGGARPPSGETTEWVSVRQTSEVCAGMCPNYEITVHRDGRIVADHFINFQVTAAEAARFHALLAPFRRTGTDASCGPFLIRPAPSGAEIEVIWSGPEPARLLVCDGRDYSLVTAIGCAMAAIHFTPLGDPLAPGQSWPREYSAGPCPAVPG